MDPHLIPSDAQLAKLMSLTPETPVAVLNLLEFNARANYQPEDPEYGTDAADQVLIGPEDANWHVAAIMYFPSRGAFMSMMANPDFQQTSRHRKAALKRHYMIHLNGETFQEYAGGRGCLTNPAEGRPVYLAAAFGPFLPPKRLL